MRSRTELATGPLGAPEVSEAGAKAKGESAPPQPEDAVGAHRKTLRALNAERGAKNPMSSLRWR